MELKNKQKQTSIEDSDTGDERDGGGATCCPMDHTAIGKEVLSTVVQCNIDQLFTMLFTNSKFYTEFQTFRGTTDLNQTEWKLNDDSNKTRQLTFNVRTGQRIGPKSAHVTETQTLLPATRPGFLYVIQSETVNAGVPYADAFTVNCHYCLTKLSANETRITAISKIIYLKAVLARPFIERNATAGLTDFLTNMEKALKEECAKSMTRNAKPYSPLVFGSISPRVRGSPYRYPRKKSRAPDPLQALNKKAAENVKGSTLKLNVPSKAPVMETRLTSLVLRVLVGLLCILLLLNVYLFYKMAALETAMNPTSPYPEMFKFLGADKTPETQDDWVLFLKMQKILKNLNGESRNDLAAVIKSLYQTEKDLEKLKQHMVNYSIPNRM